MIKSRVAKLEARYQVDPQDKLVTLADVQGWRDRGIPAPDCCPAGESLWGWLEKCSDETLRMFIELNKQSPQTSVSARMAADPSYFPLG